MIFDRARVDPLAEPQANANRRRKILHIITDLDDGGAEAMLFRLVAADTERDHRIISLSDGGKYGPMLEAIGISVQRLGLSAEKPLRLRFWPLVRLIRAHRPDCVQTWMYHADFLGGIAARLAGCRNVVWGLHHTTLDDTGSKRTTKAVVAINARLSHFVPRKIISCSQSGKKVHEKAGYAEGKIVVIPNGHDLSMFHADRQAGLSVRRSLGVPENALLFGMVARFNPQKDHGNLLTALAILDRKGVEFKCLLVGSGADAHNKSLADLVAQAGLGKRILLLGMRNDIPAVMNALDLFILPSAFGEAFPNVLCEAMACCTPVVATDVGDSALIVGETGEICRPRDAQALAGAIERMLPRLRDGALLEACRTRIDENFTLERMRKVYAGVWQ